MENETVNKIIELDIDIEGMEDDELEEYGVEVISLVDDPAIGVDFHYFNAVEAYSVSSSLELDVELMEAELETYKENLPKIKLKKKQKIQTFSLDDDKRIATGPLMIPNKMIHRRDEDGGVYYIYFTKDTIRRMAEKFLRLNKHNNTDVDHSFEITTNNTLLESWISEDKMYDKAYKIGFALPMGTWYVSYKINDDETWRRIKEGELKGFSLAGPFIEKMATSNYNENLLNDIKKILSKIDE